MSYQELRSLTSSTPIDQCKRPDHTTDITDPRLFAAIERRPFGRGSRCTPRVTDLFDAEGVLEGKVMNTTMPSLEAERDLLVSSLAKPGDEVVQDICDLNWRNLSPDELIDVAWTYYYFSIQFRENLEIARKLLPNDAQLEELDRGERDTDNLSPCPGVVGAGERVNHDEFMRRALLLAPIDPARRLRLEDIGTSYLDKVRAVDPWTKATSMASYEDGGLEKVFGSMLQAPHWDGPLLQAFKHFLEKHIEFDSDAENGHGGLCRHLPPNEGVRALWTAFKDSLVCAAPSLA